MPLEYRASAPVAVDVHHEAVITETPYQRESVAQEATDITSHEIIDNIGTFRIPRLGGAAIEAVNRAVSIDSVPGASSQPVVGPGAPVTGSREKIVIGGIDEFKGGDPGHVIGFDQVTKK